MRTLKHWYLLFPLPNDKFQVILETHSLAFCNIMSDLSSVISELQYIKDFPYAFAAHPSSYLCCCNKVWVPLCHSAYINCWIFLAFLIMEVFMQYCKSLQTVKLNAQVKQNKNNNDVLLLLFFLTWYSQHIQICSWLCTFAPHAIIQQQRRSIKSAVYWHTSTP